MNNQQTINKTKIIELLKRILSKFDFSEQEILPNRKLSIKHESEIEVLIEHLGVYVEYTLLDNQATRSELFYLKSLLEDNNGDQYAGE